MRNTPIPRRDIETESSGSGPVITRMATPEELAKYSALPAAAPRNSNGEKIKRPVQIGQRFTPDEQRRRAQKRYEEAPMNTKNQPKPTKEDVLRKRAEGKTHTIIEADLGLPQGSLSYWLTKWNLKGLTPDQAKTMLESLAEDVKEHAVPAEEKTGEPVEVAAAPAEPKEAEAPRAEMAEPEDPTLARVDVTEDLPQLIEDDFLAPPLPTHSRRYVQSAVVGASEQITDELAALITYIRAGNGEHFHLELTLREVPHAQASSR